MHTRNETRSSMSSLDHDFILDDSWLVPDHLEQDAEKCTLGMDNSLLDNDIENSLLLIDPEFSVEPLPQNIAWETIFPPHLEQEIDFDKVFSMTDDGAQPATQELEEEDADEEGIHLINRKKTRTPSDFRIASGPPKIVTYQIPGASLMAEEPPEERYDADYALKQTGNVNPPNTAKAEMDNAVQANIIFYLSRPIKLRQIPPGYLSNLTSSTTNDAEQSVDRSAIPSLEGSRSQSRVPSLTKTRATNAVAQKPSSAHRRSRSAIPSPTSVHRSVGITSRPLDITAPKATSKNHRSQPRIPSRKSTRHSDVINSVSAAENIERPPSADRRSQSATRSALPTGRSDRLASSKIAELSGTIPHLEQPRHRSRVLTLSGTRPTNIVDLRDVEKSIKKAPPRTHQSQSASRSQTTACVSDRLASKENAASAPIHPSSDRRPQSRVASMRSARRSSVLRPSSAGRRSQSAAALSAVTRRSDRPTNLSVPTPSSDNRRSQSRVPSLTKRRPSSITNSRDGAESTHTITSLPVGSTHRIHISGIAQPIEIRLSTQLASDPQDCPPSNITNRKEATSCQVSEDSGIGKHTPTSVSSLDSPTQRSCSDSPIGSLRITQSSNTTDPSNIWVRSEVPAADGRSVYLQLYPFKCVSRSNVAGSNEQSVGANGFKKGIMQSEKRTSRGCEQHFYIPPRKTVAGGHPVWKTARITKFEFKKCTVTT